MELKYIKKNLIAYRLFTSLKIKKILSFRANVISQTLGMFINNFAFLLIWYFLFKRFGNINGYSFKEILLIEGFVTGFFAIFFLLFGGVAKMGEILNQDGFLNLQLYPVSPLTLLTTKSGSASQFGDFIQGSLLLIWYLTLNPGKIFLVIFTLIIMVAGFYGVSLFVNSLNFFFPKLFEVIHEIVNNIYIGASMYPSKNFQGILRIIFYFMLLIPIVSIPIEVTRGFYKSYFLGISLLAVIFINLLGLFLWKKGIRRVESGSSVGFMD